MENSGILLSAKADLNRVLVSDGPPQTALCLLSPTLPSIVSAVKFTIISHDQGHCDDSNAGTWTWFETSIVRPQADSRDIPSDLFDDVNANVEDFIDQIAGHGWSFLEIPGTGGRASIVLARNPVSRNWQTHEVVWDRNDNEEKRQFVSLLQEGDRVVVWARAQFPGWINFVRSVQLDLVEEGAAPPRDYQRVSGLPSDAEGEVGGRIMVENEGSSKEEEEDEEDNTETKREQLRKSIAFMRELKPDAFEDMPLRSSGPLKDHRVTELMMSNWNPMEPPGYDHLGLLPYEYVSLPSTTSIRVMKVLETENGLLHCTLRTIDILDRSVPYHCLSYTWGNPHADGNYFEESFEERGKAHSTQTWPIVCDGKLMLVPKNLFDGLHQLPRNAWARRLDREDKKGQTIVHKLAINGGMKVTMDDVDLNMAFRALAFVNQREEMGSIFHALQAAGADIQTTDSKGRSALHHAAENGHIDAVKSLVALGLDATARDHEGKTAAEYAAGNGRQDIAKYLQQSTDTGGSYQACKKRPIHCLDRPDDWIWIDKICINQADMEELQSQIQIMDIIYSKAAFVKVWLGEEDPLTGPATELIQMIHGAPGRLRDSHIVPYRENTEQAYISAGLPVVSYGRWLALGALYRRQWFRRVWVFQEIVSANDVVMWCGRHEIPFAAFVEISRDILSRQLNYGIPCSTFLTPPTEAAHHLELDMCMMYKYFSLRAQATILNSKRARQEFSMSRLVDVTRTLSSTVPKDKVFAVLGLISLSTPGRRWRLEYSLPTEKLFAMITRNIMAEQGTLEILKNGAADSMNNVPGLPSWVPDFSVTASRPLPGTPNNRACGDRHQVNSVLLRDPRSPLSQAAWYALQAMSITPGGQTDDPRIAERIQIMKQSLVPLEWNVLRVEGALFDRVKHVGKRRSMTGESVLRLDTSWFDLAEYLDLIYPTGEGRSEAFWRTLCANRTPTNDRPPDSFGDQFRETLCKIVCGEAQNRAAAARASSPSGALLEVLMAQALGISHAVRKTTDADTCFRQLNDGLEQLDRLAGSEAPERSYFPSRDSIQRFWESSNVRIFSNEGRLVDGAFGQPFEVSYLHVYGGRRLYVTERKYIGLGPQDVAAGDGVWILPGSYVPRVLREQTLEGGIKQYRMVGDTYLHGIMQGEAMEGLGNCFQTVDLV